ncbi:MAG TPA: DNA replication/repair protein RecF [Bdellovibrionota bacterium]|jgi:DNA replication and repair protein RecF|nr:DNA replication/repair protein RecF [Bdellovibrionota bacterium]
MKVQSVQLRNFRNVRQSILEPHPGLNFLVGRNAQGKTSFVEAIHFLSSLRSFRNAKPQEVIRWGEDQAEIRCRIHQPAESGAGWDTDLELKLTTDRVTGRGTKLAAINGKTYRSSVEYLEQKLRAPGAGFHTIVFNPSDHELVRGEPRLRREYLDRVVCAESVELLQALKRYHRVLEQRNRLLKEPRWVEPGLLEEFSQPLLDLGAQLVHGRLKWLERLQPRAASILERIAPKQASLGLFYSSDWLRISGQNSSGSEALTGGYFPGHAPLPSLELVRSQLADEAARRRPAELQAGTTLVGPHRDDWGFSLEDRTLKGHGSQGEVRSTLVALKMAEVELFREATGLQPLFLLDDFSSELDGDRREFLLGFLRETDLQVFVTTTEESRVDGKRFRVEEGLLSEA